MTTRREFLKKLGIGAAAVSVSGGIAEAVLSEGTDLVPVDNNYVTKEAVIEWFSSRDVIPEQEFYQEWQNVPVRDTPIPQVWAQEAIAILEENMVVGNAVHRDFNNSIAQPNDVVNAYKPGVYTIRRRCEGEEFIPHLVERQAIPLDGHFYTSFIIRDGEACRSLSDLTRLHLYPAMMCMARGIDDWLLEAMEGHGAVVYHYGSARDVILDAREKLNMHKAWVQNRHAVIPHPWHTDLIKQDLMSHQCTSLFGTNVHPAPVNEGVTFQRDAVVLVNRPLPVVDLPGVQSFVSMWNDISIRCTMSCDPATASCRIVLDSLFGRGVMDEDKICHMKPSKVRPGLAVLDENLKTVLLS